VDERETTDVPKVVQGKGAAAPGAVRARGTAMGGKQGARKSAAVQENELLTKKKRRKRFFLHYLPQHQHQHRVPSQVFQLLAFRRRR